MAELNRRINEDRTAASSNYEIDRLNSLLRIKENEIAQLLTRINNDASASAVNQEAEYRVTTLEKRVEVLNNEIEKYNAALITKNKEICELKSQNFELDKLSKNNIELKSAVYEVEKLTEILTAKSSELANLKASHQMLEKKFQMAEASSKELEALRGSVS
jgi:TolA-binding protein